MEMNVCKILLLYFWVIGLLQLDFRLVTVCVCVISVVINSQIPDVWVVTPCSNAVRYIPKDLKSRNYNNVCIFLGVLNITFIVAVRKFEVVSNSFPVVGI
jgi:hypothetical protein